MQNQNITFDQMFIYPSVTEILSPFSGLHHVDPEILEKAGLRGSKVHEYAYDFINNISLWDIDSSIDGYIRSLKKYWGDGYVVLIAEERFFCDKLKISGQPDLIVKKDNKLVLIDWKTSAVESKTWQLQGSAYAYLARLAGHDIQQIEFVKLDKKGNAPQVFIYEENFDLFMKCYEVYNIFFKKGE